LSSRAQTLSRLPFCRWVDKDAALVTSCHRGPREQSGARRDPVDLSVRELNRQELVTFKGFRNANLASKNVRDMFHYRPKAARGEKRPVDRAGPSR
jgi:hypothetical protein